MKILEKLKITKLDWQIAVVTLVVLGGAFAIFQTTSVATARSIDIKYGYIAILVTFIVGVVAFAWNAPEFCKRIRDNKPTGGAIALGVVALGFFSVFILSNISNTHRVLSDETSWESMALQMYYDRSGGVCNEGVWTDGNLECVTEVNNFKGKAMGLVESFAYAVLGPGRDAALAVNFPLYLLSLVAFFLALRIWLKNEKLAFAAMLFLGGMPIYMLQARSASTEVLYIFLLAFLMLWYAVVPAKQVQWKHFALTVPLLGLFAQTRQETVFAFIPFALYYIGYFRQKLWRLPLFVASVIAVSWPSINTMAAYRGYDFQGGEHAAHSLENFWFNLKTNIEEMMNLDFDPAFGGIMKNPFYTTFTVILLAATVWLLVRAIGFKRYRRGACLAFFFCFQIFVILLNVSGTFTIDINQRYVLVALPLFAIIMALGLCDFIQVVSRISPKWNLEQAARVTVVISALLSFGLAIVHVESFKANMLYYKNKLLGEEDFLHHELAKLPENSIFIYARPWQMLASGHTSFSERTFMNWNNDKFSEMFMKSNGNIYVVRGQDGRGTVDKKSRVVGFKTTNQIEQILEDYKTTTILQEKRLFGYPLSIYKIVSKRGVSQYRQGLAISEIENGHITWHKNFESSFKSKFLLNGSLLDEPIFSSSSGVIEIDSNLINPGLNSAEFECYLPDGDTVKYIRDVFKPADDVALVSDLKMVEYTQAWGNPQIGESVDHNALTIDGISYRYGIGSHASSRLKFEVPANMANKSITLYATFGMDDESVGGDGASFAVSVNGNEIFQSTRLYSGDAQKATISLGSARTFELITKEGDNKDFDHADFVNVWIKAE